MSREILWQPVAPLRERKLNEKTLQTKPKEKISLFKAMDNCHHFTKTIFNEVSVGIILATPDGKVTFANRMALTTLGMSAEECQDRFLPELFSNCEDFCRNFQEDFDNQRKRFDVRFINRTGSRMEFDMTIFKVIEETPSELGMVLLFRDLGLLRQFETEMQRIETISILGHMTAGFAHEVRNPLAGLKLLAQATLDETDPEDTRSEYVNRIMSLLTRIEQLLSTTLQFGQSHSRHPQVHNPQILLTEALSILAPRFKATRTLPKVNIEENVSEVYVDEGQLVKVLVILIENSVDAVGDPANVMIQIGSINGKNEDGFVSIQIIDTGAGITDDHLSHIFTPFYTTKPNGTGLGLSIAQGLIRDNGGQLLVRSLPETETVFQILLPKGKIQQ